MENRKGLSNIIATVLIVLLALAAVAIVWGFIRPSLDQTGTSIDVAQRCLDSEVRPISCSGGVATVQYVKGASVVSATAILNQNGTTTPDTKAVGNLTSTSSHDFGTVTPAAGDTVTAAAVVTDQTGAQHTCDASPVTVTCG